MDDENERISLEKEEKIVDSTLTTNETFENNVVETNKVDSTKDVYVPETYVESQGSIAVSKKDKINVFINIFAFCAVLLFIISLLILANSVRGKATNETLENNNPVNVLVSTRPVNVLNVTTDSGPFTASQIYDENINSVVTITSDVVLQSGYFTQRGQSVGSGFIISADGYIVTNYHVVEGAEKTTVLLYNGKEYEATLVGYEEDNDVAVLMISPEEDEKFIPVILGDSDNMVVGEDVVAVGNPLGTLTFSMTKGIVSALSRAIQVESEAVINMFQVDCAVNEGNSGGPIFNMYGEVIGIVSAKYASETIEGLGFCIPINDVYSIVEEIIQYGKVIHKAYMGISVIDVDENAISRYNLVAGAFVSVVEKDGPGDKAGLKVNDIIVEFDGKAIKSVNEMLLLKKSYKSGDTIKLKVYRAGEYVDLSLTFDDVPIEDEVSNDIYEDVETPTNPDDFYNYPDDYSSEDYPYIPDWFDYFFGN